MAPRRIMTSLLLGLLVAAPRAADAGDFVDTRITWTFGDDDLLTKAGEAVPDSPLPSIGDREGYELFMDNLDSKTSGRENLTNLVLYRKVDGFLPGVTTEAALALRMNLTELEAERSPRVGDVLGDEGSYLRVHIATTEREGDGLSLVLFPFDTERFRMGWLWDISWGGGGLFSNRRSGPAPGAKLAFAYDTFDAYVGFKTATVSQTVTEGAGEQGSISVRESNYGFLAGVGRDITDWLRVDAGGAYFEQGAFDFLGLIGSKVRTVGSSVRISAHDGVGIGSSMDMRLYRNDPTVDAMTWWHENYVPGAFSWSLSVEGTALYQTLADSQSFAQTRLQPAIATAVNGKIKWGYTRVHAIGLLRNLEFILHNVPSLTPFVALPGNATTTPELFAAAGVDHHLPGANLTPSLTVGVQLPSTFRAAGSDATLVIRDASARDRLPPGEDAVPILHARAAVRWDLSELMAVLASVQYVRDANSTRLEITSTGERRTFQRSDLIGAYLVTRARF